MFAIGIRRGTHKLKKLKNIEKEEKMNKYTIAVVAVDPMTTITQTIMLNIYMLTTIVRFRVTTHCTCITIVIMA